MKNMIKINDKIKDNDPRTGNRILIVEAIEGDSIRARRIFSDGLRSSYPKKGFKIKLTRIHTDGKVRRGGFTLLP